MIFSSDRLRQFFAAYFHQDWRSEYCSYSEAVADYSSCGELEDRKLALLEIEKLISLSEQGSLQEKDLYQNFGCYYMPSKSGVSVTEWLINIKTEMSKILESREKS